MAQSTKCLILLAVIALFFVTENKMSYSSRGDCLILRYRNHSSGSYRYGRLYCLRPVGIYPG